MRALVCLFAWSFANVALAQDEDEAVPILEPSVLAELDYRAIPYEAEGNAGFAIGRLQTGLVFRPEEWMRGLVVIDFANESPNVFDAFVTFVPNDFLEIDVGFSRPPLFYSSRNEPLRTQALPDRSPVETTFGARADVGVDVHLAPKEIPIEAWARVGNGSGSPLGNDNALPAGYATLDLVLGRAFRGASGRQAYGLRAGGALFVEDALDRDGVTAESAFGFRYHRAPVVTGRRAIGEAHVVGYAGPVRLIVEGAIADESRSLDDDGNPSTARRDLADVESYGFSGEILWTIFGGWRDVGRQPLGGEHGALELAARFDGLWLDRDASDVESGGSVGGVVSLKWWPTSFLAATLAGYVTHYENAPIEEPDRETSWSAVARIGFFYGSWGAPLLRAGPP